MNVYWTQVIKAVGVMALTMMAIEFVSAASSFSNSFTTFTGDSTWPATQAAVGNAGFNFFNTTQGDIFTSNPTVIFDANGATFGSYLGGDGGRNYIRTNISDYATVSFVAEITFTVGIGASASDQQLFFGMGSGNTALYGLPDWSTQVASTFVQPQINGAGDSFFTTFRTQNDANEFVDFIEGGYTSGTHRLRMTFDKSLRKMTYAIDLNYVGGAFVPNITPQPVDLNHIDCPIGCGDPMMPISADFFGLDGWPVEPSRLYFGGDDWVTFRDFSVVVSNSGLSGDYNNDGFVNAADYVVWRDHLGAAMSLPNDSSVGVGGSDYGVWKQNFGQPPGAASAAVPEPAITAFLIVGVM